MSDAAKNYWEECIADAAQDGKIDLTMDQIRHLAKAAQEGHECYSMAFYSPPAGEYLEQENKRLSRALSAEQAKVGCPVCRGRGRIIENFGTLSSNSPCDRCNGSGKI